MSESTNKQNPEALGVALELTYLIIDKSNEDRHLKENPENFILNVFERCLHVANGGHARTAYLAQDDDA